MNEHREVRYVILKRKENKNIMAMYICQKSYDE